MRRIAKVFEKATINLEKSIKGISFDDRDPVSVPKGDYFNMGSDDKDKSKVVISDIKTGEVYIVSKKDI